MERIGNTRSEYPSFIGLSTGHSVSCALLGISLYNPLLYPVLFVLTFISSHVVVEIVYGISFSNIIIRAHRKKQPSNVV